MKKIVFLLLTTFTLLQLNAKAQAKQKAEKAFLTQVNAILKNAKQQHWNYTGTMTVDSMFAINEAGILSVTVRYTGDDSAYRRVRMEVSVANIIRVAYDLYLILECKEDAVALYESEPNSNYLVEKSKSNYFHIGVPQKDGYTQQEKLQKMLNKVLTYYNY